MYFYLLLGSHGGEGHGAMATHGRSDAHQRGPANQRPQRRSSGRELLLPLHAAGGGGALARPPLQPTHVAAGHQGHPGVAPRCGHHGSQQRPLESGGRGCAG